MVKHFRFAYGKFIAFPPHVLNEYGQMELPPAGNLQAVWAVGFFHPQGYVCVQFPEQTVSDMAGGDEFPFLPGKGAVIYNKVHGNGRLGNLLEINGAGVFRGADGVADMDIRNAGNGYNGANFRFCHVYFI